MKRKEGPKIRLDSNQDVQTFTQKPISILPITRNFKVEIS